MGYNPTPELGERDRRLELLSVTAPLRSFPEGRKEVKKWFCNDGLKIQGANWGGTPGELRTHRAGDEGQCPAESERIRRDDVPFAAGHRFGRTIACTPKAKSPAKPQGGLAGDLAEDVTHFHTWQKCMEEIDLGIPSIGWSANAFARLTLDPG